MPATLRPSSIDSRVRPNVAVTFGPEFQGDMKFFGGVADYTEAHTGWHLFPLQYGFENMLEDLLATRELDGIIGSFVSDAWIRAVAGDYPGLAMVNVGNISRIDSVCTVTVDNELVGQTAAEALLNSGVLHFAYAGISGNYDSELRRQSFRSPLLQNGFECSRVPVSNRVRLSDWLEETPKPVGVFCSNDYLARRLIQTARLKGLAIPETLAVIGVGNSPLDSLFCGIPLSSIGLPHEQIGRSAAHQLHEIMEGRKMIPSRVVIPPEGLYQRETTARNHGPDSSVERALTYIKQHIDRPFTIQMLAQAVGVSRRTLELSFRRVLQRSPYREVQRQREELAKLLLGATNQRIWEIAQKCGYPEQHQFSAAFRRWTGMSPRAFRLQSRQSDGLAQPR